MLKLDIIVNKNDRFESILKPIFVLVLYGLIIAMAFLVNPFLFFYYEEKEEEGQPTSRVWENTKKKEFDFK